MEEREIILRIEAPEKWDFTSFVVNLANNRPVSFAGCKVYEVGSFFSDFRERIEDAIVNEGLSNLLRRQPLVEAVVPPGERPDRIRDLLVKFLAATGVDEELIIVDPYFFATSKDPSYPSFVSQIISPFARALRRVNIITLPDRVNSSVKENVVQGIQGLSGGITVNHAMSTDYHDRFWISASRSKGILTGSSLNGLGRRYAVIDRLAEDDVRDIVDGLVRSKLI
jgi:hypothetical protein